MCEDCTLDLGRHEEIEPAPAPYTGWLTPTEVADLVHLPVTVVKRWRTTEAPPDPRDTSSEIPEVERRRAMSISKPVGARSQRTIRSRLFRELRDAEARIGAVFNVALSLRIDRILAELEAQGGRVDQLQRAA